MSIDILLRNAARRYPGAPAVTQGTRTLTYAELDARADGLAGHLIGARIRQGDRVAVLMENRPEMLVAYAGTFRAGGCLVPLNPQFIRDDVEYHLEDSGARFLVHSGAYTDLVSEMASNATTVAVDGAQADWVEPSVTSIESASKLADPAWLFYTSGTTGRPKGAVLTHAILHFVATAWLADLERMRPGHPILHVAPLTHGAGFHALAAIAGAAHQYLLPGGFEALHVLEVMERFKIAGAFMVPTHIRRLLDAVQERPTVLPHLRGIIYGGGPILRSDLNEALEVFDGQLVQIYAQGETPMTATVLWHRGADSPAGASDEQLHLSAGLPRVAMDVTVLRPDDSFADPDEVGEICVRGPAVMEGYWGREEATAETLRGGWLHTGDVGRCDERGFLYVLDRLKDLIITGGQNVYAREVEDVLGQCPNVEAVAVIGLPDRKWGEAVTAAVVPTRDDPIDEDSLRSFARDRLAGFKRPKRFVILDELPTSAYGKILKRELRDRLADHHNT